MPERTHRPGSRYAALIALTAAAACLTGCSRFLSSAGDERSPLVAPEFIPPGARLANDGIHQLRLTAERARQVALDVRQIEDALIDFTTSEGRPPASLDELVARHYLPSLPTSLKAGTIFYDPDSLKITVVSRH